MMRLHWKIMFYRRFQWHSSLNWWSIYCYESTFASSEGLKQRCCYNLDWWSDDATSLILGPPYGGHVVDYVSRSIIPYCNKLHFLNIAVLNDKIISTLYYETIDIRGLVASTNKVTKIMAAACSNTLTMEWISEDSKKNQKIERRCDFFIADYMNIVLAIYLQTQCQSSVLI